MNVLLYLTSGVVNNNNNNNNNKMVAYLHAGPHKTGTSSIQATVIHARKTLLNYKLAIWPDFHNPIKQCFSDGYLTENEPGKDSKVKQLAFVFRYYHKCIHLQHHFAQFVSQSANRKHNIFISTEAMLPELSVVRSMIRLLISNNYIIHGIMSYRFHLNWAISYYNQLVIHRSIVNKELVPKEYRQSSLLSEYLMKEFHKGINHHKIILFRNILLQYNHYQFSVIDYYGTEASKKPLLHALLCEIVGVICDDMAYKGLYSYHINDSKDYADIIEKQMAFVFVKFAMKHNCSLKIFEKDNRARLAVTKIAKDYSWRLHAPLRVVNMTHFARHSLEIDRKMRETLGSMFVNANETANSLKVNTYPVMQEVDDDFINHNDTWIGYMMDLVSSMHTNGFCN